MPEGVLVVLTETGPDGRLSAPGLEALGLGKQLADLLGTEWDVLVATGDPDAPAGEAAGRGAGRVFTAALAADRPVGESIVGAAQTAAAESGPRVVVVNRGAQVLDVVPRLAARLGGGCVMGVTETRVEGGGLQVVASIYGGAARGVYRFTAGGPAVISGAPGAAVAPEPQGAAAEIVPLTVAPLPERVRIVEALKEPEGPRLEDSPVVVSGGRGIKKAENYALIEQLASALGGMPGASRAIVDDAWATPAQQVGLTGKIVTPRLYVAAGISGASQHMAGCSNSRVLVAINTDPEAPIFRYATFGVVDDCLEVLPELLKLAGGAQ